MRLILFAILPIAMLGACETLPTAPAYPAAEPTPIAEETADTAIAPAAEEVAAETAPPKPVIVPKETYIQYRKSVMVHSLVSESIMNDDVALMGLLSGSRTYCGLDWQPGFVTFINLANRQGLNLERVADDHGYYMGAAKRALEAAEYECSEQDMIDLRAIDPY